MCFELVSWSLGHMGDIVIRVRRESLDGRIIGFACGVKVGHLNY